MRVTPTRPAASHNLVTRRQASNHNIPRNIPAGLATTSLKAIPYRDSRTPERLGLISDINIYDSTNVIHQTPRALSPTNCNIPPHHQKHSTKHIYATKTKRVLIACRADCPDIFVTNRRPTCASTHHNQQGPLLHPHHTPNNPLAPRSIPPRREPYLANPSTDVSHAHTPPTLRSNADKAYPPLTGATRAYHLPRFSYSFSQGGPRRNRGWPGRRQPETTTTRTHSREQDRTQITPRLAPHTNPKQALQTGERHKISLTHSAKLAPIEASSSATVWSTSTIPLYLTPLTGPRLAPSQASALYDHLSTSQGVPWTAEYGLSGQLEPSRASRPFRISRVTPAHPRPEGRPGLTSPERPARPVTAQKATLVHHRPHHLSRGFKRPLRAPPGSCNVTP